MTEVCFIPSRGRALNARKLADSWVQAGIIPHFVVEPDEAPTYASKVQDIQVHPLPIRNGGIGFSRNHCVNLAASFGHKSMILADDDIKPAKNYSNMVGFAEAAKYKKVLGITARYGYHDLCLGPKIRGRNDLILLPTGTFRLVALNVDNVLDLGNYDHTLDYAEDCDLFLRGLKEGYPWMIHLGTRTGSIGTRYQPGGMLDYAVAGCATGLDGMKPAWHRELHNQYPDVTNAHTEKCAGKQNCIRVAWRKAYDKYMPEWKEYSALHGGDLHKYLKEYTLESAYGSVVIPYDG